MATFSSHPDLPEILENLLEEDVHTLFLKADCPPRTKSGGIGNLRLADVEGADDGKWDTLRLESLQEEILSLIDENRDRSDCFLEIDRKGCQVIQLGDLRISCAWPPFADAREITIVRPVAKLSLGDYEIDPKLISRLSDHHRGVFICGRPGSGKTTLAKLLLRLYDPVSGAIKIGDSDIKDVSIESLRNKIGVVNQETFLFDGSIRKNIAYGNKDCEEDDIIRAAEQSQCTEFISSLSDGYDTIIGERGQKLSGGQKQRLAIARAIVRQPDILIFDEATSSVDNKTERLIQKTFMDIKQDRTMIIIAHRLSTIRNCDNIFVIKNSRIHEQGTHDELMKNSDSFYAELWNIQTGKKL